VACVGSTERMIGFLVAGLIIGALARLILPGRQRIGLLMTLLLGVLGSLIGGTIANALQAGSIWELNFVGFVAAVAVSVGLLAVAERSGLGAGDPPAGDLPRRA
jgi:uncharacterized membrane protein YeaQ/YmgE (transglycosylase-associated protein family)